MIKTLRFTSCFTVVLAVIFFIFPVVFGVRGVQQVHQIEQFLNSVGAIEQFKQARGVQVDNKQSETPPLVKQAEVFALYLNPPPKPVTVPTASRIEPRPKSVSPKFRLVGTSRHSLHPQLSLALIDEPGKGLRWVRQESSVGHLVIEQVKDGLIVVRDGENTFELVAERPQQRSLIKATPSSSGRITNSLNPQLSAEVYPPRRIQSSAEEQAAIEAANKKILAELDAMLAEAEAVPADGQTSKTNSGHKWRKPSQGGVEDIAAAKKRPISNGASHPVDPETMRISAREARGLGHLGRRLKNIQQEPNRVANDKAESGANGVSHPQVGLIDPNGASHPADLSRLNFNDVNVPG
jgi:hypothetical protein